MVGLFGKAGIQHLQFSQNSTFHATSDHVRKKRLEMGLTQKEVADQLGVVPWTILNWEKDRTEPSIAAVPVIKEYPGRFNQASNEKKPHPFGRRFFLGRNHRGGKVRANKFKTNLNEIQCAQIERDFRPGDK